MFHRNLLHLLNRLRVLVLLVPFCVRILGRLGLVVPIRCFLLPLLLSTVAVAWSFDFQYLLPLLLKLLRAVAAFVPRLVCGILLQQPPKHQGLCRLCLVLAGILVKCRGRRGVLVNLYLSLPFALNYRGKPSSAGVYQL